MIEHALEDCITRMRLEGASPEECLAQYPEYRHELEPMLSAALGLGSLEALEPRPEFRNQTRIRLQAHMRANPRRRDTRMSSLSFRYAASLASLFALLVTTGTALAQNALPGDSLYGWKLASEKIWRGFQSSPVDADIYLSGRRVTEMQTIQGYAKLEEIGVGAYTAVLEQLNIDLASHPNMSGGVSELLMQQREALQGIFDKSKGDLPELDDVFGIVVLPDPANDQHPPAGPNENSHGQPPVLTGVPPVNKKYDGGGNASEEEEDKDGPGQGQGRSEKGHRRGH